MKLSQIKANPNNPRVLRDEKFQKLKKSIEDFPKMMELRPIIVDENNTILGGNMRFRALQDLGYKEIENSWVKKANELTEKQKQEFIIKDNVSFGEWNWDDLANEWDVEKLNDWGLDIQFEEIDEEVEEDGYEEPEDLKVDVVLGDLIEIGEHKLLCGDSVDSEQVAKLMGNSKADLVFTDPPYDIAEQDYSNNIYLFSENAHIFVMHDDKGIVEYLRKSQLDFSRFYVANFGFSSPRGNDPYLSHILVSQEKKGTPIPHKNLHDGFRSIIPLEYRFRLKDDKTEHKHQKPINFISLFIEHFSNVNSNVLDLFLGSGSTMVAAHQLKRKCYGMELDPKYCQVIIDRMLKLDNSLVVKINGKNYKR